MAKISTAAIFRKNSGFTLIVFILSFLFFSYWTEASLFNFNNKTLFTTALFPIANSLQNLGGFAAYCSLFLLQFYTTETATALVISVLLSLTFLTSYKVLRSQVAAFALPFALIPVLLFAIVLSRYQHNLQLILSYNLALLSQLSLRSILPKHSLFSDITEFILLCIWSYLFGLIVPLVSFLLLGFEAASTHTKQKPFIGSIILIIKTIFCLALLWWINPDSFHKQLMVLNAATIENYIFWILMGIFALALVIKRLNVHKKESRLLRLIPWLLPLLSIVALFISTTSENYKDEKLRLQANYYSSTKNWTKVIETCEQLPMTERINLFNINRALAHQGALLDKLFQYPQYYGEHALIPTSQYSSKITYPASEIYYDLGHIKESTHWAYEALTKKPKDPRILQRIALNNILLKDTLVALKFLDILSESKTYKKWTIEHKNLLYSKDLWSNYPQYKIKRSQIPEVDGYSDTNDPGLSLYELWNHDHSNKMAFDYYTAQLLMTHKLVPVVSLVQFLKEAGYSKIPRHMEEAILMFQVLGGQHADLGDYHISKATNERFKGFSQILGKYKGNKKNAQSELKSQYQNTYWYYIYFVSPITTKRKFKS